MYLNNPEMARRFFGIFPSFLHRKQKKEEKKKTVQDYYLPCLKKKKVLDFQFFFFLFMIHCVHLIPHIHMYIYQSFCKVSMWFSCAKRQRKNILYL